MQLKDINRHRKIEKQIMLHHHRNSRSVPSYPLILDAILYTFFYLQENQPVGDTSLAGFKMEFPTNSQIQRETKMELSFAEESHESY